MLLFWSLVNLSSITTIRIVGGCAVCGTRSDLPWILKFWMRKDKTDLDPDLEVSGDDHRSGGSQKHTGQVRSQVRGSRKNTSEVRCQVRVSQRPKTLPVTY